ncbi:PPR: pentatricopeptide repeat domain containing protein [Nitzschia inconspicua]|uniref:PPR: pentatricopeptide repeat domain containing protein n=1 Tax=Nitzschia inconspicua TaxID=303405 RepID=A0A9K3M0B7_9STRA|nr:PPR: pentatricopeptide repeat domain containing protein [Nitzschia inconspicua]
MIGVRNVINVHSSLKALRRRIKLGSSNVNDSCKDQSQHPGSRPPPPLNVVLSEWKREYIREDQSSLPPHEVLQTVDDWKRFLDKKTSSSNDFTQQGLPQQQQFLDNEVTLSQRPDAKSYMYILEAATAPVKLNFSECPLTNVEFADNLLFRLLEDAKTDYHIQPTSTAFLVVCKAWANVADRNNSTLSSYKIEQWIQRLQNLQEEGWPGSESPNVVFWNILLNAWSKEGNITKIEETLQRMIQNDILGVSPDTVSFSTLLAAYSRVGTSDAASNADSLLHQMLELYQSGVNSVKPNVVSFTSVMQCHAKQGNMESVLAWLQKLEELYEQTRDEDLKPDVAVYNTCLSAFVQARNPKRAHEFLRSSFTLEVPPNERSYNLVLSAWAKEGNPYQAEATLQEMHDLYANGSLETKPTVVSYNTVLSAYAKLAANARSRRPKDKDDNDDAPWKRAENILQHMESLSAMGDVSVAPNERTWNIVIDVCAKSGRAEVAEKLLERILSTTGSKSVPSIRTWNAMLSACMHAADLRRAKRLWARMQEDAAVHPDIVSYNTYLNCYVRASMERQTGRGGKHGISKQQEELAVEALIRQIQEDPIVAPNRITYLAQINFWISRDDPGRAELVLAAMVDQVRASTKRGKHRNKDHQHPVVPPDRDLFHKVMAAWIPLELPKKAETLLLTMSDLEERHGFKLRPNFETYNIVLECWAKSRRIDSGERAEAILREMEALSTSGDKDVRPTINSYNRVLNAWANSRNPTAVTRTDSLILEMILKQDSNTMPNAVSYNTWIKTIALSNDIDKPKRAKDVLKMMKIHDFRPSNDLLKKIQDLL